jgi:Tfp pilus assembly protein PilV
MRRGFTIIELIVMMVVMGIAFATLPMILQVSGESAGRVSDLRGLYHGVAKMQVVLGKPWDEANVDDFQTGGIYYVLRTQESDVPGDALYCDNDKNRSGHYPGFNRRMCENAAASALLGRAGDAMADYDDIDDFNAAPDETIEGYGVGTVVEYVRYGDLAPVAAGTTSNLKKITVSVTDRNGRALTDYRYYAANIGLSKPFIKRNQ